jgi:hypothetical protein
MDRMQVVRNVAIIVVIAAAVAFLPGGGRAANTVVSVVWVGFAVGFGFLGLRLYRERKVWAHGLGDRHRALLYSAVALALFAWAAKSRWWETSLGELAWFAVVAFIVWAAMEVYRRSRSY